MLKDLLKNYESIIKFSFSFSARKKVFFLNPWQERKYWEQMSAEYNVRWARAAIEPWMDYYPSVWMPIDYIEEIERRKAQSLQQANGDKKWGLEIGIRYFPSKEYFPPVFIHELVFFKDELSNEKSLFRKKSRFKYLTYV